MVTDSLNQENSDKIKKILNDFWKVTRTDKTPPSLDGIPGDVLDQELKLDINLVDGSRVATVKVNELLMLIFQKILEFRSHEQTIRNNSRKNYFDAIINKKSTETKAGLMLNLINQLIQVILPGNDMLEYPTKGSKTKMRLLQLENISDEDSKRIGNAYGASLITTSDKDQIMDPKSKLFVKDTLMQTADMPDINSTLMDKRFDTCMKFVTNKEAKVYELGSQDTEFWKKETFYASKRRPFTNTYFWQMKSTNKMPIHDRQTRRALDASQLEKITKLDKVAFFQAVNGGFKNRIFAGYLSAIMELHRIQYVGEVSPETGFEFKGLKEVPLTFLFWGTGIYTELKQTMIQDIRLAIAQIKLCIEHVYHKKASSFLLTICSILQTYISKTSMSASDSYEKVNVPDELKKYENEFLNLFLFCNGQDFMLNFMNDEVRCETKATATEKMPNLQMILKYFGPNESMVENPLVVEIEEKFETFIDSKVECSWTKVDMTWKDFLTVICSVACTQRQLMSCNIGTNRKSHFAKSLLFTLAYHWNKIDMGKSNVSFMWRSVPSLTLHNILDFFLWTCQPNKSWDLSLRNGFHKTYTMPEMCDQNSKELTSSILVALKHVVKWYQKKHEESPNFAHNNLVPKNICFWQSSTEKKDCEIQDFSFATCHDSTCNGLERFMENGEFPKDVQSNEAWTELYKNNIGHWTYDLKKLFSHVSALTSTLLTNENMTSTRISNINYIHGIMTNFFQTINAETTTLETIVDLVQLGIDGLNAVPVTNKLE